MGGGLPFATVDDLCVQPAWILQPNLNGSCGKEGDIWEGFCVIVVKDLRVGYTEETTATPTITPSQDTRMGRNNYRPELVF